MQIQFLHFTNTHLSLVCNKMEIKQCGNVSLLYRLTPRLGLGYAKEKCVRQGQLQEGNAFMHSLLCTVTCRERTDEQLDLRFLGFFEGFGLEE